ncbi:MAG TPA: type II toxin-antitoxin system VapC family toxin [Candidatus Binatia bacterium]|nr:type II toxin-antitoxin system VapC family toxin [Candidatus Binatia bacterium]
MFYVDTCVYLNLFRKEVSPSGRLLWKDAQDFFQRAGNRIVYSELVEREFTQKTGMLFIRWGRKVSMLPEDLAFAEGILADFGHRIGSKDCIHIALAKKCGAILVTRDRALLECASRYVVALLPENAL